MFRSVFIFSVLLLFLSGCRVVVSVPEGGAVISQSGSYDCGELNSCIVEVNDVFFDETFAAQPRDGFTFTGWKKRDRGFFGGSDAVDVRLFTSGFGENETLMRILGSDETFYLEPTFERDFNPASFALVDTGVRLISSKSWRDSPLFSNVDPAVMDVDQDGFPDIVDNGPLYYLGSENDGFVNRQVPFYWLRNNGGDGTFSEGDPDLIPQSAVLVHTRHIEIADFNQDGLDDMVAVGHGFDVPPYEMERNLILQSTPGQPLSETESDNPDFTYAGFSHALDVGDISGDGAPDIVWVDLFNELGGLEEEFRILINDGLGNFARDTSAIQLNQATGKLDVALADLDGDEAEELIFGSWNEDGQNQVFWNNGSGKFDADVTVLPKLVVDGAEQYDTLAIATTDLNFDGLADLILSVSRTYDGGHLQFLINNGDRTFTDRTDTYGVDESYTGPPVWLYVADFNGDGRDDILTDAQFMWLRTSGDAFEKYVIPGLKSGDVGGGTWPVDYDLDGDLDIVSREFLTYDEYGASSSPTWRIIENKLVD
ncbi:hypothetical protein A3709_02525 [Halioglobus sp. HI00S01]|uniref:FG-GAP repeat domain-containing protein n=1 Tax=Halioglobus sp. HI00S01 TaxID=1822214 RepID=UPI0007C3592F|nr:VCBS repeat-containing protein [Halioglobus sp. HI00S01]KZX58354.1 hypothetical protein A3709_02525 [Halioglobus sp. HI00S01]